MSNTTAILLIIAGAWYLNSNGGLTVTNATANTQNTVATVAIAIGVWELV